LLYENNLFISIQMLITDILLEYLKIKNLKTEYSLSPWDVCRNGDIVAGISWRHETLCPSGTVYHVRIAYPERLCHPLRGYLFQIYHVSSYAVQLLLYSSKRLLDWSEWCCVVRRHCKPKWMKQPTNTSKLEKRPEVSKRGNFYKDSLHMHRSVHATYPNILVRN